MTGTVSKKIKSIKHADIIGLFILSRVIYLAMMLISGFPLSTVLNLFDAENYVHIAESGYDSVMLTAFFPLLPLIIRYTTIYGALIINNLCFLASLFVLKKLNCNPWILAAFALGPMGFFTMLLYTEGMFVFFTLLAFYLMKERKIPLLTGILLGLSVMTRSTGSLLFFAVFIGMCIQFAKKEIKFRNIIIAYVPATLLALVYPGYLQIRFGNWKLFVDCQYSDWYKVKSSVFKNIWIGLKMIFTDAYPFRSGTYKPLQITNEVLSLILLAIFTVFIVYTVYRCIKDRKIDIEALTLVIYIVLTIIAVNSTIRDPYLDAPTVSYYRYYYACFPIYLMYRKTGKLVQELFLVFTLGLGLISSLSFCINMFFY